MSRSKSEPLSSVNVYFADRNQPRIGHFLPAFPDEGVIPRGCPVLVKPVPAGFPSPAVDFAEEHLSLDEHLIKQRDATFFVKVAGQSMTGFGIHDGDLLVVDRSVNPVDRCVVIAVVDGNYTVKQLCRIPQGVLLRSNNQGHGDILVSGDQELTVWGVVRYAIHTVCP